jgi:hypothetical protein
VAFAHPSRLVGVSRGGSSREASSAAAAQTWRLLPPLPQGAVRDEDGAGVAAVDEGIDVAVVNRDVREMEPSRVGVYSFKRARWSGPVGGVELPVNRGEMVTLLGGRRACVVGAAGRFVLVRCLVSGSWRQIGPPVFKITPHEHVTSYAGAFLSGGRMYVIRGRLQHAHVTPDGSALRGRLAHDVLTMHGFRWQRVGRGEIDPAAVGGTQRPFGLTLNGAPCLAYDSLGRREATVRVRCLESRRWRSVAPHLTTVDATRDRRTGTRSAINVDGAAALRGRAYLGLDYFHGRAVEWPVLELGRDRTWRRTKLGGDRRGWNEQGSLYSLGERLWAVEFDQRDSPHGLRVSLFVRRLDQDGRAVQVGQPLISDTTLFGPLYWGLAEYGRQVYALASLPSPLGRHNDVRLFELRQGASRSTAQPAPSRR